MRLPLKFSLRSKISFVFVPLKKPRPVLPIHWIEGAEKNAGPFLRFYDAL